MINDTYNAHFKEEFYREVVAWVWHFLWY
jgi:hypothetical protein